MQHIMHSLEEAGTPHNGHEAHDGPMLGVPAMRAANTPAKHKSKVG
jgi:hypothetical protein